MKTDNTDQGSKEQTHSMWSDLSHPEWLRQMLSNSATQILLFTVLYRAASLLTRHFFKANPFSKEEATDLSEQIVNKIRLNLGCQIPCLDNEMSPAGGTVCSMPVIQATEQLKKALADCLSKTPKVDLGLKKNRCDVHRLSWTLTAFIHQHLGGCKNQLTLKDWLALRQYLDTQLTQDDILKVILDHAGSKQPSSRFKLKTFSEPAQKGMDTNISSGIAAMYPASTAITPAIAMQPRARASRAPR
jgi:hypothetical protein